MTVTPPVYLDYHATTPCDPRVVEAMLPTFSENFGNAASNQHGFGARALEAVERARAQVASLLSCEPAEIVFTSGATESDNLAIKGAAHAATAKGRHVVTSAIEHKAVLDSCESLEREGFTVTYVAPETDGVVSPRRVEAAIRDDTTLVSIMYANNELGTVNPVGEIGRLCKQHGVLFHCDAVQALPYLPCDVEALGIDLLAVSGHKMYGPKGVGALYVRRRRPRARLTPLLDGGGHERGLRSGTLNTSGVVGLGVACELVGAERECDSQRVGALRDRLLVALRAALPDLIVNGSLTSRLPNNLNVSFPDVRSDALLRTLTTVAMASGSACSSAESSGSYVLKALPAGQEHAESSIRISLGRFSTAAEIDFAAPEIAAAVSRHTGHNERY